MQVDKALIKDDLKALGINTGDCVFCHSSLKSMGVVEGGADTVIDAFLEVLGAGGTLVLPALCRYDWAKMPMDVIETNWNPAMQPTFTGIIPETFRKRNGVIRSDNVTHSVAASGALATFITEGHKNAYIGLNAENAPDRPLWASRGAWGTDSPWDRLCRVDAKYMFLGVDFNVCTLFHHVQTLLLAEAAHGALWPKFNFLELGHEIEKVGLVQTGKIGVAPAKWINAGKLVDAALKILRPSQRKQTSPISVR